MAEYKYNGDSISSMAAFQSCGRLYYWSRIRKLVPMHYPVDDPRSKGSALHDGMEAHRRGRDPYQSIRDYWLEKGKESDPDIKAQMTASLVTMGQYIERWGVEQADHEWELIAVESELEGPLFNVDGQPHPSRWFKGKMDGLFEVPAPSMWGDTHIGPGWYLYELKSWSSMDSGRLRRMHMDPQILLYSSIIESAPDGRRVEGVLYDVAIRPDVKWRYSETKDEFAQRRSAMAEQAEKGLLKGRLKQRKGETEAHAMARFVEAGRQKVAELQPIEGMTAQEYATKIEQWYGSGDRFAREFVPIDNDMRAYVSDNYYRLAIDMAKAQDAAQQLGLRAYRQNFGACYRFGRECDYARICASRDNAYEIEQHYYIRGVKDEGARAEDKHSPAEPAGQQALTGSHTPPAQSQSER